MSKLTDEIQIFEMAPRDGLQNEKRLVSTVDKIKLVDLLSRCGYKKIEVTSFVSPKWVPQMADASEVMAGITRKRGTAYTALTPNIKGYQAAKAAKADEIAVFASASEGFSQKNINCSIADSIERFRPVIDAALRDNIPVRGYVSCVTHCPYDGATSPQKVAEVAALLFDAGCYQISLGDTIGKGTPGTIGAMLDAVTAKVAAGALAGHYHDTNATALSNIAVSIEKGLRTFDASIGGLGGCPYAPGAAGNVNTQAVVDLVESMGFKIGLDKQKLGQAADFAISLRS